MKRLDLVGEMFGRLAVMEDAGNIGLGSSVWKCECVCGEKIVVGGAKLKSGHTKSCGCLKGGIITHGHSKNREYRAWEAMKRRCAKETCTEYKDYGARGISVCKRWMDFKNFLVDMGECPPNMMIERINNNGNYEPSNCKWATRIEQGANKRNNRIYSLGGATKTLAQWSRDLGINYKTLWDRLDIGWSFEKAATTPVP